MTLGDATAGFIDHLSPGRITGNLTARRDDRIARQIQFAISQIVTDAIGESRTVDAGREAGTRWIATAAR